MTPDEAPASRLLEDLAGLTQDELEGFFRRRQELVSAAVVETLCAEVTRLFGIDLEKARALAAAGRWLADALDDDACRARSDRAAANVMHSQGEGEQAQALYRAALERFEALGDAREAAITRSSALLNLAFLGEYRAAFEGYEAARHAFERLGDRPRLAILEHNYGNVLFRQDRWAEALRCYAFAHREFHKLDRPHDVATCLRNVAVCHIHLHQLDEALEVYERARAYCREHALTRLLLQIDYNVAYLFYLRGEYTRAIQLYHAVRRDCEAAGDAYQRAVCDLDQAEMYLDLNLVADAAKLARAAFTVFDQMKLPYESAKALTSRALARSRQGQGSEAFELLGRARAIFVREKNRMWPALIDFYRAMVLYREHRPREAVRLAQDARRAFSSLTLAPRAAMCETLLARLWLELGRPKAARAACRDALERLSGFGLPALEHQAYLVLGQVEEAAGDRDAALEAYRRSHQWLEKLRSQLQEEDLKIAFLEDKLAVYENLVWLTLDGGATDAGKRAAFDYVEQAKSRSLADLLAFRAHALPPKAPAPGALTGRIRTLREELAWLYRQIDRETLRGGARSLETLETLRADVRRKEDELLDSLRELKSTDRELSSLQSGAVADLETVRASLPRDATLVEYFIARGTILVAVVDRETLEIVPLAPAARVRKLHRFLQFQLSRLALATPREPQPLERRATRAYLRELYEALIGPIRHLLTRRHLVFVPHGFLHTLPLHALHDAEGYLVDRFAVSYAPSAGVFHLCAAKEASCEDTSLVLGIADERAPHILEEARAVARSLPGATLLLGEEASEEALRRHGPRSRFLHIATHGLFRRDNPMFSAIQLGGSRLALFDLYDLQLGAELVVLSGCGTGLGTVLGADELVGLTRGLLYAGARSVLVTLWDVHDASTAAFMSRFYDHLAREARPARALRRTMRDLRGRFPHPYHWAPFILVGKA